MTNQTTNINDILDKVRAELGFKMRLYDQRDNKASLELKRGKHSYKVDYIYEPVAVFKSFIDQHRNLFQKGPQGCVFLNFFANNQQEWILQINRCEDSIEISLDKAGLLWRKLSNKFYWTCSLNEYTEALYLFVDNLPDHPKKQKGGIKNG